LFPGVDLSPSSSALVILREDGGVALCEHFKFENTTKDFRARVKMSKAIFARMVNFARDNETYIRLCGLEDYAMGVGQNVPYQIGEVGGMLKFLIMEAGIPLSLVNPRKLRTLPMLSRSLA
jgi:hypothetical protein